MSRIDELIAELCSGGVEFRQMRDLVEVRSGWGFPSAYQGQAAGAYPFYKVSDMNLRGNEVVMGIANHYVSAEVARRLGANPAPAGTVIFPKIGAAVATNKKRLLSVPAAYDNNVMGLVPRHDILPGFLFQWMQTFDLTHVAHDSGAVPSIRKSDVERIRVPVPPLEVQGEVVRVLDTFTELEAELEAELGAELEARRRQYAHYRNALLDFPEGGVRWVPMGRVGEFIRGRRFTKRDLVEEGIPAIHYGDIYTRYRVAADEVVSHVRSDLAPQLRFARPGDVVLAAVGETVEDVAKAVAWLGDVDVAIHDDCFAYRHAMNAKYVSYYLQTTAFQSQKNCHVARAKVKRLSAKGLAMISMPVPPLEEQARIVAILDKFDTLVNDLSSGLPAELAARRKQYEHYRDRLLTFKEAAA